MTLSLENMRSILRNATGNDEDDLPDDDADLLLNRSFWALTDKFPFRVKEIEATFPTVIGERKYSVPVLFEALRSLSIKDPDTLRWEPIDRVGSKYYDSYLSDKPDERSMPDRYMREGKCIKLLPIPDKVYTIRMRYLMTLADLSNTNDTPSIPQVWHEIIAFGAAWRKFFEIGDHVRMQTTKKLQNFSIAEIVPEEAKEEIDSSRIGLGVLMSPQDMDL